MAEAVEGKVHLCQQLYCAHNKGADLSAQRKFFESNLAELFKTYNNHTVKHAEKPGNTWEVTLCLGLSLCTESCWYATFPILS